MKTVFKPIQTLNQRTFKKNKGRNLVAIIAILMTAIMFTTLFTLAQSMSKNMVEMTFRQTGYDGQAELAVLVQCIDIVILEKHRHSIRQKLSRVTDTVQRVPRET